MRLLLVIIVYLVSTAASARPNTCSGDQRRELVLSGEGARPPFKNGSVCHLVVDRQCDFLDTSSVSVGALNGAVLAEATTQEG
jgi:hypothetical protein